MVFITDVAGKQPHLFLSFDKKSHSFIYHISLEIPVTQTVFWKVTKQVQDNISAVYMHFLFSGGRQAVNL